MQDTFEMLEELLEQEQFELLFPKENGAQAEWECYETYENNERKQGEKDSLARVGKEKNPGDIRLVYLMNDAVESFLIFRDARLTGSYLENYEGPLKSSLYTGSMAAGERSHPVFQNAGSGGLSL